MVYACGCLRPEPTSNLHLLSSLSLVYALHSIPEQTTTNEVHSHRSHEALDTFTVSKLSVSHKTKEALTLFSQHTERCCCCKHKGEILLPMGEYGA